jgi:glycosyltransferase involved in cell wall biosynthesis
VKVCYFGTYRAEYSRNQIMIQGLRLAGVDVVECHTPLWTSVEDRVNAASGGWASPRFIWRVIKTYLTLLRQHRAIGDYDILVVAYPGQFDVYLAWLLARLRRKPLVWDVFMSVYLIALERGLDRKSRFTINVLRLIERLACRLPDGLILDTTQYVEWFQRTHQTPPDRFCLVPTGADDRVYRVVEAARSGAPILTLIYYGTFIRNHGVPTIIEAAHLLSAEPNIQFVLIGRGPEKETALALAQRYQLTNVSFIDWVNREELPRRVAQADVCLGVFGTTPQSMMTVQNKIYEALAMSKPLITGDSAAVRDNFVDGEHLILVERANPRALADAVIRLYHDPALRLRLGQQGYQRFCAAFSTQEIGRLASACLSRLMNKRR